LFVCVYVVNSVLVGCQIAAWCNSQSATPTFSHEYSTDHDYQSQLSRQFHSNNYSSIVRAVLWRKRKLLRSQNHG